MKILVTGSSGFIGEFLVAKLKNLGHTVIEFDLEHGHNILNKDHVNRRVKNADVIFHLAAIIDTKNPKMWGINVDGTQNIVNAAVKAKVKKFVFLSSTGVYGFTKGLVDELTPVNPMNEYEKSKVKAEEIVLERQEEINVSILRSSMVLGPNQYWSKMFQMIKQGLPLPTKGTNSFQVIYIRDLVEALAYVMKKGDTGEIYLVAGKEMLTLNEVYIAVRKIFKQKPVVRHMPAFIAITVGKLFRLKILSSENIRHLSKDKRYSIEKLEGIGWKSQYPIEKSLRETVDDLKEESKFN